MKSIWRSHITVWLTTASLLLSLTAGIMIGDKAHAASGSTKNKVSPDLSKKVKEASPGSRVSVIMRAKGSWSATLDTTVKNNGGTIKRKYTNFNLRAIDLPVSAVNNLANRTDVEFLSMECS